MDRQELESLFQELLDKHRGAVLKVARAYSNSADDGQDLLQDILLQLWRSLPNFQRKANGLTWVYRVALNTALSWRRYEQRRRTSQHPAFELKDIAGPDASQSIEQREMVERLYVAIRELPKPDTAIVLLYLDGLTYAQMADVLGISESNVGVKLNRTKHALAELMRDDLDES